MNRLQQPFLKTILVACLYFGVAIVITYPLITVMSTHLFGDFFTDAYQTARHVWWIKHALQNGESLFQQTTLGYPDGLEGAWLWANPLEYFPGWLFAFVMPLNTATNLMLLLQLTLNGVAAYCLIDHLTEKRIYPAVVGGMIFMAFPALQGRIYGGQAGVLALWGVPLLIYALYRLREDSRRRWYLLAGVCCVLGIAGNSTLLVYYLLPTVGMLLLMQIITKQWQWLRRSLMAMIFGGLLCLVLLIPLLVETITTPQYTLEVSDTVRFSADLLAFASPSIDGHPFFDSLSLDYPSRVLGLNRVEGIGYIGVLVGLLALLGFWKHKQARWWLVLALVAWVFSLGALLKFEDVPVTTGVDTYETHITLPWAGLQNLPILNISRTPGRFNLTAALALSVMASYGMVYLWGKLARLRFRQVGFMLLGVLILFELQMFWGIPTDEVIVSEGIYALAERDDIRAVFSIPWNDRVFAKHNLYLQSVHEQNIIAGQFIRDTPVNPARLVVLQETLDPAILDFAGVDVVIFHRLSPELSTPFESLATQQLGSPIHQDPRMRIYNVPDVETLPQFTVVYPAIQHITTAYDLHFFAPDSGWARLQTTLHSDDFTARTLNILLNNTQIQASIISDAQVLDLWIPIAEAGFHTVSLQLDPLCPRLSNDTLRCNGLQINEVSFDTFIPTLNNSVELSNGVTLNSGFIGTASAGEQLSIGLWWHFDEGMSDFASRFVHVIHESGEIVAQADHPLFADNNSELTDSPNITLPMDLPAGRYRVYTGFYTYPDITRFTVFSEEEGAVNGLVLIGEFELE